MTVVNGYQSVMCGQQVGRHLGGHITRHAPLGSTLGARASGRAVASAGMVGWSTRDEVDLELAATPLGRDEELGCACGHAVRNERRPARVRAPLGELVHDGLHVVEVVET